MSCVYFILFYSGSHDDWRVNGATRKWCKIVKEFFYSLLMLLLQSLNQFATERFSMNRSINKRSLICSGLPPVALLDMQAVEQRSATRYGTDNYQKLLPWIHLGWCGKVLFIRKFCSESSEMPNVWIFWGFFKNYCYWRNLVKLFRKNLIVFVHDFSKNLDSNALNL